MVLSKRREAKRAVASEAWKKLSVESRSVIRKSGANEEKWQRLVARVGADAAVEHAEVATAMGMADAVSSHVAILLNQWERGVITKEDVMFGVRALGDEYGPRLDDVATAQVLAATSADYPTVGSCAIFYVETMVKMAEAVVQDEVTNELAEERADEQRTYEYACFKWDRQSNRPSLPLVGNG